MLSLTAGESSARPLPRRKSMAEATSPSLSSGAHCSRASAMPCRTSSRGDCAYESMSMDSVSALAAGCSASRALRALAVAVLPSRWGSPRCEMRAVGIPEAGRAAPEEAHRSLAAEALPWSGSWAANHIMASSAVPAGGHPSPSEGTHGSASSAAARMAGGPASSPARATGSSQSESPEQRLLSNGTTRSRKAGMTPRRWYSMVMLCSRGMSMPGETCRLTTPRAPSWRSL
mmetsp:Transcript_21060/g.58455  ORF Transcript_21060/g.58455 Transcript_21060/m.58455 type:complete len:231 (-) Transcript_21060:1992-2684(-)